MKITVREALEITPLKDAKILAGEESLDREILSTNIVEVPDTVRWMRGGEIMFSSGFAFSGDAEKGIALLSSLNSHGIAALVLKPGVYMSRVPEAMIDYASQIGFPLLEIPSDMPFNVYIEAIYALLLDKRTYLFNLEPAPCRAQGASPIVSGELNDICKILVERISATAILLSPNGTIVEIFKVGKKGGDDTDFEKFKDQAISEWDKTHHLTQIIVDLEPRAYLAVKKNADFPSLTDIAMMEYAALMFSAELVKEKAFVEQIRKYRSTLLKDLISKNYGDLNMLKRRCELLQINLHDPYLAYAIHTEPNSKRRHESKNMGATRDLISNTLERSILKKGGALLLTETDDDMLGVFSFSNGQKATEQARQILQEMLGQLQACSPHIRITVGISSQTRGIEQISHAIQEAREALAVNARLPQQRALVSLDELGFHRILCELKTSKAMHDFYDATLQGILEKENGEELLRTLECYYDNECNLRKTAEVLFLHKNSVKYRLSRIEEIIGKSVTDSDSQLHLRLCLQYRQFL